MKKWLTAILTVAFTVCLFLGLSACIYTDQFGNIGGSGSGSSGGSSSSGSSGSSGGSSAPKEDNDGTFIYSGASVKAANPSISGDIVIPASHNGVPIDTIPASAFKGCTGITSITVPESVTSIGEGAFNGCYMMKSITLPFVGSKKGNSGEKTALFGYIFGGTSYQGGARVQQDYAPYYGSTLSGFFYIPTMLRSVTITNESIISRGAFQNCEMLTSIQLNDEIILVGISSFANCSKIQHINLPSISDIPFCCFLDCSSLVDFTINDQVDSIGGSAFSGCIALSSINSENEGEYVIPDTVNTIDSSAFHRCILLKSITLPFIGSKKGNSGEKAALFGYIFGETSYQGGTRVQQDYAPYYGSTLSGFFYIPTMLRSVTITNESIISRGAFQNCEMLTSIMINSGARNQIGIDAFSNTASPTWF